jgi:hypothetical protein
MFRHASSQIGRLAQATFFNTHLVGGLNPSEKSEFVSWDDEIPNIWKVKKFHGSKPPTRLLTTINHY